MADQEATARFGDSEVYFDDVQGEWRSFRAFRDSPSAKRMNRREDSLKQMQALRDVLCKDRADYWPFGILMDRGNARELERLASWQNPEAGQWLASLLVARGDIRSLAIRASKGSPTAQKAYINMLTERGDLDILRKLAHDGNVRAKVQVAETLAAQGHWEEIARLAYHPKEYFSPDLRAEVLSLIGDVDTLAHLSRQGNRVALLLLIGMVAPGRNDYDLAILRKRRSFRKLPIETQELLAETIASEQDLDKLHSLVLHRTSMALALGGHTSSLQARAQRGDLEAQDRLAAVTALRGDMVKLRALADHGIPSAQARFASMLASRGAMLELRSRADLGDSFARTHLAEVLAAQEDIDELRVRADGGDSQAQNRLADVLFARGLVLELQMLAESGVRRATFWLAWMRAAVGRTEDLHAVATHMHVGEAPMVAQHRGGS